MDITLIRQRLHNYLETAENKKVKAIYIMIENEIVETGLTHSKAFKAELDQRYEAYKSDPSTVVSAMKSKKRIRNI